MPCFVITRTARAALCVAALAAGSLAGAAETVKIAFIEVLSGPFAQTGMGSLAQLRDVVSQLNASAGPQDPKFEVVPFDQLGLQTDAVTELVPRVAKHPGLRQQVRGFQEMVANQGKAILAGRDIGTVVAPHADLKLYLDVSLEERAARRQWADDTSETQEELAERLRIRDDQDRSRATSPLKIPDDAVVVCTDKLSVDDAVSLIVAMCGLQVDPA